MAVWWAVEVLEEAGVVVAVLAQRAPAPAQQQTAPPWLGTAEPWCVPRCRDNAVHSRIRERHLVLLVWFGRGVVCATEPRTPWSAHSWS